MQTKIKNSMPQFIKYLTNNQSTFQQLVDLGVKTHMFETPYAKKLSSFCVDVLSGDMGSII